MGSGTYAVAEVDVQVLDCPPAPDLLRMAAACIESVFSAMLREAPEEPGASGWREGVETVNDAPPLTPLLLDCHGGVAGSEFQGVFENLLQCLRDRLNHDAATIDEGPRAITCPGLAWRAYIEAGDGSPMEFRARFNSLPAQGYVEASECHRARSSSGTPSAAPAPPTAPHALGEVPPAVGTRPVSCNALPGTLHRLEPCRARTTGWSCRHAPPRR